MIRILVTGSNGQLGSELRDISCNFEGMDFVFVDLDNLDISDFNAVSDFFKSQPRFDFIVNAAAYTQVDKAENEPEKAKQVNSNAVGFLAEQARKSRTCFIHISTDYVFDGTKNTPYTENDFVNPVSVYGQSKIEGEMQLINSGATFYIIRTSWLYSSYGSNFVKTILRHAKEKDSLKVVFDQVGTPTYAADLAAAILSVIQQVVNNQFVVVSGVYHFSNEGVCSWYDFATELVHALALKTKIVPILSKEYPTPVKRPAYSVLDKQKLKLDFGIEIPHWRQSLKKCLLKLESGHPFTHN